MIKQLLCSFKLTMDIEEGVDSKYYFGGNGESIYTFIGAFYNILFTYYNDKKFKQR